MFIFSIHIQYVLYSDFEVFMLYCVLLTGMLIYYIVLITITVNFDQPITITLNITQPITITITLDLQSAYYYYSKFAVAYYYYFCCKWLVGLLLYALLNCQGHIVGGD